MTLDTGQGTANGVHSTKVVPFGIYDAGYRLAIQSDW